MIHTATKINMGIPAAIAILVDTVDSENCRYKCSEDNSARYAEKDRRSASRFSDQKFNFHAGFIHCGEKVKRKFSIGEVIFPQHYQKSVNKSGSQCKRTKGKTFPTYMDFLLKPYWFSASNSPKVCQKQD